VFWNWLPLKTNTRIDSEQCGYLNFTAKGPGWRVKFSDRFSRPRRERLGPSFWRTLKTGGEINPKYPGGAESIARCLRAEGQNHDQGETIAGVRLSKSVVCKTALISAGRVNESWQRLF